MQVRLIKEENLDHLKEVIRVEYNASTDTYVYSCDTFTRYCDSIEEIFKLNDKKYYNMLEEDCKEFKKQYNEKCNNNIKK